jgi:hypothetical protein
MLFAARHMLCQRVHRNGFNWLQNTDAIDTDQQQSA